MTTYETDEERVEAIKKWWRDNGTSIIAGIIIGLAAVLGWRFWSDHRETVAQEASAAFEQLVATANQGDTQAALKQAELLVAEYSSTAYATLAGLVQAKLALESGDLSQARSILERARNEAPDPGLRAIATLRLTRLLLAAGDLAAAKRVLDEHRDPGAFSGDFAALRGDLARREGRLAEAKGLYESAIAAAATDADLLRLKLQDLAIAPQ